MLQFDMHSFDVVVAPLKVIRHFKVATLSLALVACGQASVSGSPSLEGTHWVLESMPGWVMEKVPQVPTMAFKDGRVFGRSGCNSYSGQYQQSGVKLRFIDLATTAMACAYGMEAEQHFSKSLTATRAYAITNERLTLRDENGKGLAEFFKASLVPPG